VTTTVIKHTGINGGYLDLRVGKIHVLFGRCFPSLDQLHIECGRWQYNRRVGAMGDVNSNPIRQNQRKRRTNAFKAKGSHPGRRMLPHLFSMNVFGV
jgi:hypothetical protein